MKIILFMASSLNGMIAGKKGDEDFLSDVNWKSFGKIVKERGCFIIGRGAYEAVQKWTDLSYDDIEAKLKIVVSKDKDLKLKPPFILVNSPKEAIEKAAAMNFESVILAGGSSINSAFLKEDLIDEIIVNIEPAIVGSGVPQFATGEFEKRLSLIESTTIGDGILQVRYKVNKD